MKYFIFIAITILANSSRAYAWGEVGHGILASVGANLTTNGQSFYQANINNFAHLSTVPDVVWKAGANKSGETPNHWFQADYYFPSCSVTDIETFPKSYASAVAKYTQATVLAQGTAPWRVKQFYNLAVAALQAGNTDAAMQYMGVMSHYIGDMSQPLHDSMDVLYHEVARALALRDQFLNNDTTLGRTGQGATVQLALAESRMADGAATLAIILDHLWADSGVTGSPGAVTVADPSWVTPDLSSDAPWIVRSTPIHGSWADDDCAQ